MSVLSLLIVLVLGFAAYRRVLVARDRALLAEHRAQENELSAKRSAAHARHSLGEVLLERAQQALQEGDSVDAELLAARALAQEERADARGVVIAARSQMRPALRATLSETKGCTRSALSFAADLFACATGHKLTLWRLATRELALEFTLASELSSLSFASDATTLGITLADGSLGVRPATFESVAFQFAPCGQKPTALAIAAGGQALACGNARGQLNVWHAGLASKRATNRARTSGQRTRLVQRRLAPGSRRRARRVARLRQCDAQPAAARWPHRDRARLGPGRTGPIPGE